MSLQRHNQARKDICCNHLLNRWTERQLQQEASSRTPDHGIKTSRCAGHSKVHDDKNSGNRRTTELHFVPDPDNAVLNVSGRICGVRGIMHAFIGAGNTTGTPSWNEWGLVLRRSSLEDHKTVPACRLTSSSATCSVATRTTLTSWDARPGIPKRNIFRIVRSVMS